MQGLFHKSKAVNQMNPECHIVTDGKGVFIIDTKNLPSLYLYYNHGGWPQNILDGLTTKLTRVANARLDADTTDIWMIPNNTIVKSVPDIWVFYPLPKRFYVVITRPFDSEPLATLCINSNIMIEPKNRVERRTFRDSLDASYRQEMEEINEFAPNVDDIYYSDHLGAWFVTWKNGNVDNEFDTKQEALDFIRSESASS